MLASRGRAGVLVGVGAGLLIAALLVVQAASVNSGSERATVFHNRFNDWRQVDNQPLCLGFGRPALRYFL